jgi:hypothetical protein
VGHRLRLIVSLLLVALIALAAAAFLLPPSLSSRVAAASSHSIPVGPGFSDVSPHQLVRTAADVLYTVVPTCDSYPDCPNNSLRAYRADQPGTPTSFTEQDRAHRPAGGIGSSAVAIDGADTIHILWNDRSGAVRYATFATSTNLWGPSISIASTNWIDFGQGDEGVALALDANGMPHAVWSARGSDGVLHVFYGNKGGNWSPQQVDDIPLTNNRRALHPTIAFKADNTLVVAWLEGTFNYTPDGIIRVRTRDGNGSWSATQTINDPDGAMTTIDNGPSLLVTPDGTVHLTFVAANPPDQVRYWYNSGGGWQGNQQPEAQVTHDPSLGPDGSGGVRIYGHGTPMPTYQDHGDNLYSFHKGAGVGNWEPWTLYTSGSYDSSVTTRWAQFFQAHAEELDIGYWGDAYPNALYVGTDGGSGGAVPSPPPSPSPSPTPTPSPSPLPPVLPPRPGALGNPANLPQTRPGGSVITAMPHPLPAPR